MKIAPQLILILYREFVIYNLIFTVAAIPWLLYFGRHSYVVIGWIKIIGFALVVALYWFFRKERLLFFHNFRLNRPRLLSLAFAIDGVQTYLILAAVHYLFA